MVTFDAVEKMKRDWTDKYVVVDTQAPELKRFVGLTGTVKTVNMSGRALVQFDGAVDIAWYDIDPSYLSIIDQPLPKKVEAKHEPAEKKAAPAAAKATGGKSPLELARESAAKAAAAKAGGAPAAAKPAGMSPLEQARAQGAAGAAKKPTGGKSPLELAREQGAAKAKAAAQAAAPAAQDVPSEEPALAATGETAPPPAAKAPVSTTDENGKPLSKIELARRQGAFKGK